MLAVLTNVRVRTTVVAVRPAAGWTSTVPRSTATASPGAGGVDDLHQVVHPDVAREVVERAQGCHHQRQPVPVRHRGRGADRAVAAGDAQRLDPVADLVAAARQRGLQLLLDAAPALDGEDLRAGQRGDDVGERVVVRVAGELVDHHQHALAVGQRGHAADRAGPGLVGRPHRPPAPRQRGHPRAERRARGDVGGPVHADVHPRVGDRRPRRGPARDPAAGSPARRRSRRPRPRPSARTGTTTTSGGEGSVW